MPTKRFYTRQYHSGLDVAIPDMVRFLINDHPTITGPGWTIVEAQSGANREVPSVATDLDSLVSATAWPNGTLSTGDWIVLESANANNTNHFQLYIEYQSTTDINFIMFPLEDFSTGGGAATPPTFPATAVGAGGSIVAFTKDSAAITYSIVADEGMMALLVDALGNSDCDWTYIGELDASFPDGTPADDRCYVIHDNESLVSWADTSSEYVFNRLSPLDDSTVLTLGYDAQFFTWGSNVRIHEDGTDIGRILGQHSIYPVGIWFNDTSHKHFAGFLRNIYSIHAYAGCIGTINNKSYMFRNNSTLFSGGIVFEWDGTTGY